MERFEKTEKLTPAEPSAGRLGPSGSGDPPLTPSSCAASTLEDKVADTYAQTLVARAIWTPCTSEYQGVCQDAPCERRLDMKSSGTSPVCSAAVL